MTKSAPFKRRVRARMAKTGESYTTARARLDRQQPNNDADVLHVTNGDATVDRLRAAGYPDPLPWRDILHAGPVPARPPAELRRVRAKFIAGEGFEAYESVLAGVEARDNRLAEYADRPYVLWFEADLYDQLQLIEILDRLRTLEVPPDRVRLVTAGEYPGIAHFKGLGQLSPDELRLLHNEELTLDADSYELARLAWKAFTAADPSELERIVRTESAALPYLGEAFARLLQEYPARSDGLSLTERRILLAIDDGATTAADVFGEVGRRERRPYLGDWGCYAIVRELSAAGHPLLRLDGSGDVVDPGFGERQVELTREGSEVLAGKADHVRLNGIDRWIGGVHLTGDQVRWRYDERREALTES